MEQQKHTNALVNESSPYLLQHAHNPVNWMPWGDEALQKAKREDKPLIISIGYSACHWCHVMERESFENEEVAQIMNDGFICIKVDREERPDIDQVYMDACQLITGQGGWPLNAIALPDGRPLYAGTYFQREHWKQVLNYFVLHYKNSLDEMLERATEITNGVRGMDVIDNKQQSAFTVEDRDKIFERFNNSIDFEKGGRVGAPKFPMPVNYKYLLQHYYYTKNEKALQAVTVTLDNMMRGGIYDQAGGGFARYSVDDEWVVPHFEKMLYDNAQLVSLYSEAYKLMGNEEYKDVVYETLGFIEREMTDKSGGFFSALDADSEGEEGKFYVWAYNELKELLGEDFIDFAKCYDVTEYGNFEHKNNLVRKGTYTELALALNIGIEELKQKLGSWKTLLLEERSKRIRPGLDDKILTSWNALMLKGYIDAYRAFSEPEFLTTALTNANFIRNNCLQADGSLHRNYKNGKSTISGFLDDYSFAAQAFIALYEVTMDESWLHLAHQLAEYTIQHFYNLQKGLFFYTSVNDAPLITRKMETSDNVIPASNSSMAHVLYKLGKYLDKRDYIDKSYKALLTMKEYAISYTDFYANWAALSGYFINEPYEIVVCGNNAKLLLIELQRQYLPNCLIIGSEGESNFPLLQNRYVKDETLIYVCQNKVCQMPVKNMEEALTLIG